MAHQQELTVNLNLMSSPPKDLLEDILSKSLMVLMTAKGMGTTWSIRPTLTQSHDVNNSNDQVRLLLAFSVAFLSWHGHLEHEKGEEEIGDP